MIDVLLICMPFGPHTSPSIALSLLKAGLADSDVTVRVRYFSIDFAQQIGEPLYASIATDSGAPSIRELSGEWLFSDALFGTTTDPRSYVDEILRARAAWPAAAKMRPLPERAINRLLALRDEVEPFLDRCLDEVVALKPRIVGFTSIFQQHVASLALARRIRAALPETLLVMGGANCEGAMGGETVRQFDFVDAVVSGEGDLLFPEFVRRVRQGEPFSDLPGVLTAARAEESFRSGTFSNAPSVFDMDALPIPSYDDFFEQFNASRLSRKWQPGLYFETSRGCWWGERMHCTFCGLNGGTMQYRSKSSARALAELTDLARDYPDCDVQVTDNILDLGYFKEFIPALAKAKLPVDLFYETKANLTRAQIRALADAGIRKIQPGIESLSEPILKLMRKGVSALQNIQLLKWCHELGVRPYWNLLWGFPGEPAEEYERMADLVRSIPHLEPPVGVSGLRLDRFSPNFEAAEQFGFANVRPLAPYAYIYPFDRSVLSNLAYYFDFDYREARDVEAYVAPLLNSVRRWQRSREESELLATDDGSILRLWDLRSAAAESLLLLEGIDRTLYRACDGAADLRTLIELCRSSGVVGADEAFVEERLAPYVVARLLVRDRKRYLALAINIGDYQPSRQTQSRMKALERKVRRTVQLQQTSVRRSRVPRVPATVQAGVILQ